METVQTVPIADMTAQMTQLNLQTNGSSNNANTPVAIPQSPVSPTNGNAVPRVARTGIPRYAIPYKRPDAKPTTTSTSGVQSPTSNDSESVNGSTSVDEAATTNPYRSGGGVRTESLGTYSSGLGVGAGTSQRRYGRAASVDPMRGDSESEHSSVFSSSGQPRRITSKIGSLANANYKPGGGNVTTTVSFVKILDEKVDFSYAQSKCNSKANLKHKPGGGDVQIVENKLNFKENSRPRVNSLANAKHVPGGGNVRIENHKLGFKETASSRIGSLQNANHKAGGGNVKIFNEKLPWLKYNKPNLPAEEKAKINKHTPLTSGPTQEPIYTSRHSSTTS